MNIFGKEGQKESYAGKPNKFVDEQFRFWDVV